MSSTDTVTRRIRADKKGTRNNANGPADESKGHSRRKEVGRGNLQNAPGSEAKIDKARRENRFDEGIERL